MLKIDVRTNAQPDAQTEAKADVQTDAKSGTQTDAQIDAATNIRCIVHRIGIRYERLSMEAVH